MSLNLDTRQRAMLDEMGVKVWWPATAQAATASNSTPELTANNAEIESTATELALEQPVERPSAVAPSRPPPVAHVATASNAPNARPIAAQLGWSALQDAVAHCQACSLCESRKNTVFGVGQAPTDPALAPQVDWLIVGEAPGENEDLQGEPFVGQAGKLLDNMLKALGLNRTQQVYITNVLKCRPPHNRNPTPAEIAQCAPFLRLQIELLQPKIILALGRFAVQTLLADSVPKVETIALGKLRGQVYAYHGVPVVVSYHPAYLLRSLPDKAKAWADLCLAQSVVQKVG